MNVVEGDHGEFEATIEPVYVFPLMDASGVVYGYERRVYDDVTVLVDPGLPGDANGDGVVDDADASILGAHWLQMGGATWRDGDFDDDGNVNDADAAILAGHWNEHRGEQSVPEPAGLVLLAAGVLSVLIVRSRKNSPSPTASKALRMCSIDAGRRLPAGQMMATTSNRAFSSKQAVTLQERDGQAGQPALLRPIDRLGRMTVLGVGPGLDLDEHDRPTVDRHEVQFARAAAIAPGDDLVALGGAGYRAAASSPRRPSGFSGKRRRYHCAEDLRNRMAGPLWMRVAAPTIRQRRMLRVTHPAGYLLRSVRRCLRRVALPTRSRRK